VLFLISQGLKDFELTRCQDEPIHIPGAVQGFGVLIVVFEERETQNLVVRIVSENSGLVLGLSPQYLFSIASFTELLNQDQENTLRDHISFCREEQDAPQDLDGPEVFLMSGKSGDQRGDWTCWCAVHIVPHTDLIVLEFELEDDHLFPLSTPLNEQMDEKGGMSVEPYEPTEEDLFESTTKESRPLRMLNRRQQRNKSPMEHFSILSQVNEQLSGSTDIKQFVKIVVGVFKEITGFHRVMVYQVHSQVAEANRSLTKIGTDKLLRSSLIGKQRKIYTGVYTSPPLIFPLRRASCIR